ncbi:MAG: hypothetical protein PVF65_03005 [Sphingomonadales bacterium]|jgi:hypothetical protein
MTNPAKIYVCRKAAVLLSGILFFLSAFLSVDAHRLPVTTSEVNWNERTSNLEIIHYLHVHDAELGLARLLGDPDVSLQELETRARLALYVEEHFALESPGGERLPLQIIGVEADGDYALVYQEVKLDKQPMALIVSSSILRDIIPGQENRVNVKLFDIVQSIIFRDNDDEKLVQF